MNSGWMCPGCNRCYSPTTPQCFTCGQPTYTTVNVGGRAENGNLWAQPKGCKCPGLCVSKDGYCAKCHSEFY